MFDLEEAERKYKLWSNAEDAVAISGKSYSIAGRQLTRADLPQIREQMEYWGLQIKELKGERITSVEIIPRDV